MQYKKNEFNHLLTQNQEPQNRRSPLDSSRNSNRSNSFFNEQLVSQETSTKSEYDLRYFSGISSFLSGQNNSKSVHTMAPIGGSTNKSHSAPAKNNPHIQQKTGQDEQIAPADLASSPFGRHSPLDWSAGTYDINPQLPANIDASASKKEIFEANWELEIQKEFGITTSAQCIQEAIGVAQWLGESYANQDKRRLLRTHQHALINTLNVEESSRYQRTKTNTYCNIYAYDLVQAMGGYIPRVWWQDHVLEKVRNGQHVTPIYGETVREMTASNIAEWMEEFGSEFGWQAAQNSEEAQNAANNGRIVIILAKGSPGHVTVVAAEDANNGRVARRENGVVTHPLESQAGGTNQNYGVSQSQVGWWENNRHHDGNMWIFTGKKNPPIPTPEFGSN